MVKAEQRKEMEAERLKKLLDILTSRFGEAELRTLAFVIRGVGAYDDLRGQTRKEKALSLLELLTYRDRIRDLVEYIEEFRPDIDLSELETEPKPEPARRVKFVNRVAEIDLIVDSRAPQYQLVDAPAGYGKTELLKEIATRYQKQGWLCIYVEMPRRKTFSLEDVVTAIAEVGKCHIADVQQFATAGEWARKMGYQVAGCLLEHLKEIQRLKKVRAEGVILLLDSVELIGDSAARLLLSELVPGIHEGLQSAGIQSPFRAIFAGRHISGRWAGLAPLILSSTVLTPFDFSVVRHTVKDFVAEAGVSLPAENVARIASHLMHLTGGHPGCMATILSEFQFGWPADTYLLERETQHFQKVVLPVVDEIRRVHLRDELGTLSVCRRFIPRLLRGLIERGLIQHDDEYRLADELAATYLVTRKHGFLQDDITRRLLAMWLRHEKTNHFIKICQAAREIYADHLSNPTTARPEIVAIELLYQDLQLGYYQQASNTRQKRAELGEKFFAALDDHLRTLIAERNAREMMDNLIDALENDWEFQFVINYFLREDAYNEQPYQKLKQHVDDLRQALRRGGGQWLNKSRLSTEKTN
jgi:hypothetical protein